MRSGKHATAYFIVCSPEVQFKEEFVDELREDRVRQQAQRYGHLRVGVVNVQLETYKVTWGR
jgi:hypothetical protein